MSMYSLINDCVRQGSNYSTDRVREVEQFDTFKDLFKLMLDKSILYNIKKVPAPGKQSSATQDINHDSVLLQNLKDLLIADLRGNELTSAVQNIYDRCDVERKEVFKWVLDRQNPAGIGTSVVNKVWKDLIYKQLYMGAVPQSEEALDRLPWANGVMMQVKEDGMSVLGMITDGDVEIRTRQGQDITAYFPAVQSMMEEHAEDMDVQNGMIHYELYVTANRDRTLMMSRKEGNGLINSQVQSAVVGGALDNLICLIALDVLNFEEYWLSAIERYDTLASVPGNGYLRPVDSIIVYDKDKAKRIKQQWIKSGHEGAVLKDRTQPWKNGKPWFNVKMKNEFDVELIVVGIKPHSKNPDLVGSLICESEGGLLRVAVGSGLTDETRMLDCGYWSGSIVTVRAESITESKGKDLPALYLPRLIEVRMDKDTANTLYEIRQEYAASQSDYL